jgi:hypothetical protein
MIEALKGTTLILSLGAIGIGLPILIVNNFGKK